MSQSCICWHQKQPWDFSQRETIGFWPTLLSSPAWGHRTSSPYQQLGHSKGLSSFFVLSCNILNKACWPSRLSASWKNHPSRKTFFFLFPMLPFSDEPLLPGSQWPWALSLSPKVLSLALLHKKDLPKSWLVAGDTSTQLTNPVLPATCISCIGYLYVIGNELFPNRRMIYMWIFSLVKFVYCKLTRKSLKPLQWTGAI